MISTCAFCLLDCTVSPKKRIVPVAVEIISVSKTTEIETEGCLSFPLLDTAPGDPGLMYSEVEVS